MSKIILCPICGGSNSLEISTYTSTHSSAHFCVTGHDKFSNKRFTKLQNIIFNLWNQKTCKVMRCQTCQAMFADPFIAGNQEFYNTAFSEGYPQDRWEFNIVIKKLIKIPGFKNLKYLEIGSGNGVFIEKLLKIGISESNISSIEYSKVGVEKIRKLGVECENSINDLKKNKYDNVFMFQVLEHLDNPKNLFKSLYEHTNKKSIIYASTPNIKFLQLKNKVGALIDMPPNHICQYSKKAFAQFNQFGWKLANYLQKTKASGEIINRIIIQQKLQNKINRIIGKKSIKHIIYNRLTLIFMLKMKNKIGGEQLAVFEKI